VSALQTLPGIVQGSAAHVVCGPIHHRTCWLRRGRETPSRCAPCQRPSEETGGRAVSLSWVVFSPSIPILRVWYYWTANVTRKVLPTSFASEPRESSFAWSAKRKCYRNVSGAWSKDRFGPMLHRRITWFRRCPARTEGILSAREKYRISCLLAKEQLVFRLAEGLTSREIKRKHREELRVPPF
jgi:hypothetical protein